MSKIKDLERWRTELQLAEKFRDDHFGKYIQSDHSLAGSNIDFFDKGFAAGSSIVGTEEVVTTLNLVHAVVKNVVPTLYFQNPKILAFPKKAEFQDTAPIVSHILNYYYKTIDAEEVNQRVIWDAYVLGHGYYKIGYATKFGVDIEDETKKEKTFTQKALEKLGLKKPEETEVIRPELNYKIIAENPYIQYISPFDFGKDPRAQSLDEAMYWYHKVRRTVKYMKENKKYKNTKELTGEDPVEINIANTQMSQPELEDFRTVDLYEIHYRNDNKYYLLVISKDGSEYREHYHEEAIYEIDGWQCDELTFNKHGHSTFAVSDISKIRNLQERFTSTLDAILEQVDRFVPKIAYNGSDITPEGENALRDGDIGSLVKTTKNPNEVFRELAFTQLKADLKVILDQIIEIISIQTGLTRAQLTGISSAETATEASIAQGGQTLRIADMNRNVARFARKQASKLWQIVKQFVDLEELELINGVTGTDDSGSPIYTWMMVDPARREKMIVGQYDFDIEVGSTQKPDLVLIRKQFENLFSILARTDVIVMMQQQGDKIVVSELLRMYLNLFPEAVKDIGRIIQKITPQTQNLIPPPVDQGGGTTTGSNFNAMEAQAGQPVPSMPNQIGVGV